MYDFRKVESQVRNFWKEQNIFEKSLEKTRKGKRFVFWEGPPTANGVPHTGHFLTRIYKDLYGRYKTMRGFFVLRKAGWDTHGLPVEIEIEKELGFTNKKQIEEYGIAKFNRKARESVWKYKTQWEDMSRTMGFWLDMDHPYITYETPYVESVWNILSEIWKKELLYSAHKIIPFCVRCGTGLSAHEVAQGYKLVKDTTAYVKFKLVDRPNTFVLAWTTTPWTLPGNVALAVGKDIRYSYIQKNGETLIVASDLVSKVLGEGISSEKETAGSELVGLKYEPLFNVPELQAETSHKIYAADFVSTTEGTGIVHIAPMYGEDDYQLSMRENLPRVHTVTEQGMFAAGLGDGLAGKPVIDHERKNKITEAYILQKLSDKGLLLKTEEYEHEYPHCWRCGTPLLYYAKGSWFIKTSAINRELIDNNERVNWIPEHLREGRFGQWLKEAKDWTLSRERYWGTPLPIWACDQCGEKNLLGSVKELEKRSQSSKNTYYVMRHGPTTRRENIDRIISSRLESDTYHLTEEGKVEVERSLELLKLDGVDMIFASPFLRTKETAEIAGRILHTKVEIDARLAEELHSLEAEGKSENLNPETEDGVESRSSIRSRLMAFMRDAESKYRNKKILIVTHGAPAWFLEVMARGVAESELAANPELFPYAMPNLAEIKKLDWRRIPRNEYGELDLHRPFIDDVILKCPKCRSKMRRIPDLIDVWFDSGAMPYAQWHYPFENKDIFKKQFPADFIVEGMDQTRGWFWTLLAISTLLGKGAPYRNAMALGFTLDEKGVKESKSKGNYMPVPEIMALHGVDVLRWYFASSMAIGENKAVIHREITDKLKGFFFTLQNCIRFYELYAGPANFNDPIGKLNLLDRWLLSRFNRLVRDTGDRLEAFEVPTAARELEQFVIEDLSNWWVRRSRKRREALPILRMVLLDLARVLAPFTPYLAEDTWHRLGGTPESVHLADWPKFTKKYIKDDIEREMAAARDLGARGLALRKEKQMKVRQPLESVSFKRDKFSRDLEAIIKEELNIKKIKYDKAQPDDVVMSFELTPALVREGYARELMRQIQDMRKEAKYRIDEAVVLHWHADQPAIIKAIESWTEEIKRDTLLSHMERSQKSGAYDLEKEADLGGGKTIWLGIKK